MDGEAGGMFVKLQNVENYKIPTSRWCVSLKKRSLCKFWTCWWSEQHLDPDNGRTAICMVCTCNVDPMNEDYLLASSI